MTGRRAIGIEGDEAYAEKAARRRDKRTKTTTNPDKAAS